MLYTIASERWNRGTPQAASRSEVAAYDPTTSGLLTVNSEMWRFGDRVKAADY
jgi:hypothetical protein